MIQKESCNVHILTQLTHPTLTMPIRAGAMAAERHGGSSGYIPMKTNIKINWNKHLFSVPIVTMLAGPVQAELFVPSPSIPILPPPSPNITVQVGVPDSYVWDGTEYVGVLGNQYYYLGAGNLWLPLQHSRLDRFRDWQRDHSDWRHHTIRNERYRRDAQGHDHPWQDRDRDFSH